MHIYVFVKIKKKNPKSLCRCIYHPNQQRKKNVSQRNLVTVREVEDG